MRLRDRFKTMRVAVVATLATALAASSLVAIPAQASPTDVLDVSFGGSLVSTTGYTSQGDEAMKGVLQRVEGDEEQIPGEGVRLAGGTQGLRFTPANMSLNGGQQSFVIETVLTPTRFADMQTIMSGGGNFYIRAQGGQLRYGWDSLSGTTWTSNFRTAPLPTLNERHVISAHYRYVASAPTLDVWLDGEQLPTVTGTGPIATNTAVANQFGFGNDVHPAGLDRGFVGTIHRVRLNPTDGSPGNAFELQPRPATTESLNLTMDGTVSGTTYTPAGTETAEGSLTLNGGATVSGGVLTVGAATGGLTYAPETNPFPNESIETGFVTEVEFTPSATQRDLATLVSVGGNFFVRYQAGQLRYGYSNNNNGAWTNYVGTIALPTAGQKHVLSVAYDPTAEGGAQITLWLDGVKQATVDGARLSTQGGTRGGVVFGNEINGMDRGFAGTIDRARFALLNGDFSPQAFIFQTLTPIEDCRDEPIVEANYVPVSASDCPSDIIEAASKTRPTEHQLDWQELQYTGFIHFGINTFYNQEWGHGTEDPDRFNPTDIDVDSWVRHMRDNGMKMAVLTLKHHDGFMLWPTRYSDYSVASTPWKNGEGDILREFTTAAEKYGMKVGVYLSPADSHAEIEGIYANGSAKTPRTIPTLVENDDRAGQDLPTFSYEATDYGQFFLNTMYEVLTEYGQIDEVWFDGAGGNTSGTERFDYVAYYDMIRQLQPTAQIAVGGPDIRWVGNEHGVARNNEWAVVPVQRDEVGGRIQGAEDGGPFGQTFGSDAQIISAVQAGRANYMHWWASEADMKLTQGWFAHPTDSPKTASTLLNTHWDGSVGRNAVLLLNVPPTTTGQFAPASIKALEDFAALRRQTYDKDLALGKAVTAGTATTAAVTDDNTRTSWVSASATDTTPLVVDLGSAQRVDRISISEDSLDYGQQVRGFKLEALVNGAWTQLNSADSFTPATIGVNRIFKLATPVTAQQFRLTITSARGVYGIANWSLYQTQTADPGKPAEIWIDCEATVAGTGSQASPLNSLEQLRTLDLAVGADIHFKSGTACEDSSTRVWAYGTTENPVTVDTYGGTSEPVIGELPASEWFAGYENQGFSIFAGIAEDTTGPVITEIADRFVDLGSELSLGVVARDRSLPLTFEATGLPAGTSINATTGRITGTPTETGSYDVTVTVTDAADNASTVTFAVTVAVAPKISVDEAPASMAWSSQAEITFATADLPPLSTVEVEVPEGWQVSPSEQWAPTGDGTVTVKVRAPAGGTQGAVTATVTNPDGLTATASATIRLTNPAQFTPAGVAAWDSAETTGEGAINGFVSAAIDGNPNTYWHTQWEGSSPSHPHYLVVDLGEEKTVTSLTYVPRPKSACSQPIFPTACNGQILGYEISAATGGTWVAPSAAELRGRSYVEPADAAYEVLATGNFDSATTSPKTVTFEEPVTTRYLKIKSTSAVGAQAWAHIAELQVAGEAPAPSDELVDVPLGARILVSPATVKAGEAVAIQGAGFAAGKSVTITLGGTTVRATADAQGRIDAELTVPAAQAGGQATISATDGTTTATAQVTVTAAPVVDETAPVISSIGAQSGRVGTAVSIQVSATDESTPLVYSATGLPAGVTLNRSTGLVSGRPTVSGTFNPVVTVTDAKGNKASVTFRLTVAPKPTTPPPTPAPEFVRTAPYTMPGYHLINGREWMTTCTAYSQTERCRTEIWATVVKIDNGRFVRKTGWAFNNLTYLPFMTRAQWANNPLGRTGRFVGTDGAQWRTECDTAATGSNACRSYRLTTVYNAFARPSGGYLFSQENKWVFNNIVMFGNYKRS